MIELKTSFEKALSDLYTIDWSESDGSDVKQVLNNYFDDIPDDRMEIKEMIDDCASLNKFQKNFTVKVLEEF